MELELELGWGVGMGTAVVNAVPPSPQSASLADSPLLGSIDPEFTGISSLSTSPAPFPLDLLLIHQPSSKSPTHSPTHGARPQTIIKHPSSITSCITLSKLERVKLPPGLKVFNLGASAPHLGGGGGPHRGESAVDPFFFADA